ncbi:hypothetical protein WN944_018107 [Citrus x changshan-huyou]|uniref:Uncharacterized protein n=4 Tax=Citrus TaxID=2706 RepID=A0ACB8L1V9_CITSI|nr:uncharacterized protein LOC18045144 [Citrus x clementina]XP_006486517.1 uncharacterized protein LOC102613004 [Citrus sinensis]GAY40547.1 hypothetical protein CUMW_052780 [Citrus unshiu]ESR49098.1 hypothetical protein CICLE_v10032961mg [Citrus x clementina]KAH9702751.1 hypothetical protein KPL70_010875 [Citrus sinensis]KAH9767381.1 hypothetical protein KPL71_011260 [Citrus sinensis]KDO44869.1 hypothetical protein CISIN_1g031518mg [Citrus sinensis]
MVSREHKKAAALHEKLQLLRSITNSHALSKTSIIVDASNYIEELKQKVERLNRDIENGQTSSDPNALPIQVTVKTLEKGFMINVFSKKSCPGLLVSILETFEELALNVLEARVSCTDTFSLQAIGGENEEQGETIDAHVVKQALLQVIRNWSESNEQV